MKIKRAQFHSALFVAKQNIKDKVLAKDGVIEMYYDRQHKEMTIYVKNQDFEETAIVPYTNINYMVEDTEKPKPKAEENLPLPPHVPFKSAQVDSPQAHVHKGQGYGKSR